MKDQLQSQIEEVAPHVAAFADAGWRWWHGPRTNMSVLIALPAVQKELAELNAEVRVESTAGRDAIEVAIKAAIESLPPPYSAAALAQFGFSNREKEKGKRCHLAAPHMEVGGDSYRLPLVKTLGMKPWDYIVVLVTCALCGVADPVEYLAGRAASQRPATPEGVAPAARSEAKPNPVRAEPLHSIGASADASSESFYGDRRARTALSLAVVGVVVIALVLIATGTFKSQPTGAGTTSTGHYLGPDSPRGWYPERTMSTCSSSNQCDGLAYVSLNATKFAEPIGRLPADERDFMTGETVSHSVAQASSSRLSVLPGERIRVIGWVDNAASAARTPGGTRAATAVNTRFAAVLPSLPGPDIYLVGIASAGNAQPWRVGDSLTLVSKTKRPIAAHFVPGSVHLTASGRTYPLPDTTVGTYKPTHFSYRSELPTGTLIGCKGRNGLLPPGFSCAVSVSFEVEIANG